MKKIRTICLILSLLLALTQLAPMARAEIVDQSVTSGCHSPDAALQLSENQQLVATSKAVLVYELQSGTMIYSWNADNRLYPSSMVKLMTALLALENAELDERVVVTKQALSHVSIGSVSAGLVVDEELSMRDLLNCLIAASANDAAAVIAEHIAGSQEAFVQLMNQRAAELGCVNTNYTNAHGLHDEKSYTTVRDICRLMVVAMELPEFRELILAENYTVPATNMSEERQIRTTNYMASTEVVKKYFDQRVIGGKTGATDDGARCLTAISKINGMEVMTIVMGAKPVYDSDGTIRVYGSFEETRSLLDHVQERYEYRQVFFEGQIVAQYPVENGENYVVVEPQYTAATVLPIGTDVNSLTWIYGDTMASIQAPVEKGQAVSTAQVWQGPKCLAQTPLIAVNSVAVRSEPIIPPKPAPDAGEQVWRVILIILGVLLGVAALVVLVRFAVKILRKRIRYIRRRNRRMDRRRYR